MLVNAYKGRVVTAAAGKERNGLFVVVDADEQYLYIADGRKRKLSKPKRKNPKHLRFTDLTIGMDQITDKKLRIVLGNLSTP